MTWSIAAGIAVVLFLVLANFYFVAAEFAMVRSRPTKLKAPEESGRFGTRSSLKLIDDLDSSLSAIQLGITVVSLILGWYGEAIFAQMFLNLFNFFGHSDELAWALIFSHGAATTLALCVVTFLHVVIGELAAKSLAIRYPEATLRALAPLMVFLTKICRPLIFILNGAANLFLSIFGLRTVAESERVLSSHELAMLVAHSSQYGMLDKNEEEMLKGIFTFSETVAREVMTPRTDLITVPINASFQQVVTIVSSSGFSRFPVIGTGTDDVKGLLLARDIIGVLQQRGILSAQENFEVKRIMRKAFFVPGTKPIDDLLTELRSQNVHMAVVLDEHGGIDGVVTLEDIIEEIVGEIFDESDRLELDIVVEADGDSLVDGGVLVSDFNEKLSLSIAEGDYDTIAGFIFAALGRVAISGDSILINRNGLVLEINGIHIHPNNVGANEEEELNSTENLSVLSKQKKVRITVQEVEGNRIHLIRVHPIEDKESINSDNTSIEQVELKQDPPSNESSNEANDMSESVKPELDDLSASSKVTEELPENSSSQENEIGEQSLKKSLTA
jgi:CBS domain containing-hemolysin-like protein